MMNSICASDKFQKKVTIKAPEILETWRSRLREMRSAAYKYQNDQNKFGLRSTLQKSTNYICDLSCIDPELLTAGWRGEQIKALSAFELVHERISEIHDAMPDRIRSKSSEELPV